MQPTRIYQFESSLGKYVIVLLLLFCCKQRYIGSISCAPAKWFCCHCRSTLMSPERIWKCLIFLLPCRRTEWRTDWRWVFLGPAGEEERWSEWITMRRWEGDTSRFFILEVLFTRSHLLRHGCGAPLSQPPLDFPEQFPFRWNDVDLRNNYLETVLQHT